MREELRPYENQSVVVRGLLKEATHVEGNWDLLFVTCVWKPLLPSNWEEPFANVPAHKTDHLWVRVPEEVLDEWKRENPSSILLKRLEKVFTVVRYTRKDGTEDFGLELPGMEWSLYSYQLGRIRQFQKDLRHQTMPPGEDGWKVWDRFREEMAKGATNGLGYPHLSLESKMSHKDAYESYSKEMKKVHEEIARKGVLTGVRRERQKVSAKKKAHRQGPKPGRGF